MQLDHWAAIIQEAAKTPLGILALMVLAISSIALAFFRNASEAARVVVFVLMLAGVGLFAFAVVRTQSAGTSGTTGGTLLVPPPQRGELRRNAKDDLEYAWIPRGSFTMGCTEAKPEDDCFPENVLAHPVQLTDDFWIGTTEVTVGAFRRFAVDDLPEPPSFNPSWSKARLPIVNVRWSEAEKYCRWAGGRLPTEAQWEYAARGGIENGRFPNGDDLHPTQATLGYEPASVGKLSANGFGLYDMAGSVSEWVQDWYTEEGDRTGVDPSGPATGEKRDIRGGSYQDPVDGQRIYLRSYGSPESIAEFLGFRCVLPSTFTKWAD